MINIPKQLQPMNFTLIDPFKGDGKKPIGLAWQKKIIRYKDINLQTHLTSGYNYGVQMNNSFVEIDGENYPLIVIDFDTKKFQDKVLDKFPETFTTTSGSSKNCVHLWFASNNNEAFKIKDRNKETLCDVIGAGNQVIAPGSKHYKGSIYSVVKDIPIAFLDYDIIKSILEPYDKQPKKIKKEYKLNPNIYNSFLDKLKSIVGIPQLLNEFGIDTSKNPTECLFHSSVHGQCLGFNYETAHCFNCDGSWNIFSLVKQYKNYSSAEAIEWLAEFAGMSEEYNHQKKEYINKIYKDNLEEPKGWAKGINIKQFAERNNFTTCPKCKNLFEFIESHGFYRCKTCKYQGGLNKFAELILKYKQ